MSDSIDSSDANLRDATRDRLIRLVLVVMLLVVLSAVFVLAADVIWILFLSLIFGIFLSRLSDTIASRWNLHRSWALGLVVSVLLLLIVGTLALFFSQINEQIKSVGKNFEQGVDYLGEKADEYPAIATAVRSLPVISGMLEPSAPVRQQDGVGRPQSPGNSQGNPDSMPSSTSQPFVPGDSSESEQESPQSESPSGSSDAESDSDQASESESSSEDEATSASEQVKQIQEAMPQTVTNKLASTLSGLFQSTFGLVVNSLIVFFVGLYFAISPETYKTGLERLFAIRHRPRIREVMDTVGWTLWRWLIGRFCTMLITGFGAFLVVWLAGVPMAATLGIVTGLLSFVPNIGAAMSLLLAVLFALPQGLTTVAIVVVGYLALQLIESYVITPLIEQHQVSVHPGLLISAQAIMAVMFGFLGALIASPVLAALLVIIKMLYVHDYLGDSDVEGMPQA